MIWTTAIPYFSERELACKGSGVVKLDLRFAAALPALRATWNAPLTLTSVCRSPAYNESVRGHPNSLHLFENPKHPTHGTMAADVSWRTWDKQERMNFARLAYRQGWSVGLHNGFCHIDRRKDIGLQQAVFVYAEWNGFTREDVF